jgi:YfiH family protein
MQRHAKGTLAWLTFDLFAQFPHLLHGIFLRHGGVSTGHFDSLNFGTVQGDLPENVEANRKIALNALGIKECCELWQHHGKQVVQASLHQKENGDALTTNQKHVGLSILHADCQAAIFYDPVHHAVSNVHCGWQGSVQNIYKETTEAMKHLYGSKPEDLHVGISPSLGPHASEFINHKRELPPQFDSFQFKPTYFDFWQISRWQLEACGMLPQHIEIAAMCTYSNPVDFFSYRRVKASGRHATLVALL